MKSVFITGISGGLGNATARHFFNSGYQVFGTDLQASREDFFSKFYLGDITDEVMWKKISLELMHDVGHLDVLVNIAGRNYYDKIHETNLDQWRDRNLLSNYFAD